MSSPQSSLRVVVIGGGPVGAAAAAAIAHANPRARVTLFERRPAPPNTAVVANSGPVRNYNVVLSPRGTGALEAIGLPSLDSNRFVTVAGSVVHKQKGGPVVGKATLGRDGKSVSRVDLLRTLLEWGEEKGVAVRYETTLQEVRTEEREVVVASDDGQKETLQYDFLIGADGVSSKVRQELERHGEVDVKIIPEPVPYKVFNLPPPWIFEGADGVSSVDSWDRRIQVWTRKKSFIVSPPSLRDEPDGQLPETGPIGVFGLIKDTDRKELESTDAVRSFLTKWYPDLVLALERADARFPAARPRFDTFVEALAAAPTHEDGRSTFCSRQATASAVLLGDAANSMSPSLGQGANCGLESVAILVRALREAEWDVPAALERYNAVRLRDVVAAVELSRWFSAYSTARRMQVVGALMTRKVLSRIAPFVVKDAVDYADIARADVSYSSVAEKLFPMVWLNQGIAVVLGAGAVAAMALCARSIVRLR